MTKRIHTQYERQGAPRRLLITLHSSPLIDDDELRDVFHFLGGGGGWSKAYLIEVMLLHHTLIAAFEEFS